MNFDTRIFLDINHFARDTPWLQPIMSAYAGYGIALFAVLMLAGWWVARQRADSAIMAAALWAPIGMLIALAINQPIAAMVGESRPYTALSGILVLAHRSTDPSFPSDHAVASGAVAAALFLVHRGLGLAAAAAALVMAFARVYIAAHFPQDVLAGLLLGAAVSVGGFFLARHALVRLVSLLESTRLRPLLTADSAIPSGPVTR
ncbi:phosphatase PAP2 family protein [Nocardia sp. NBC_01388]|uniref:phosphatase PAP2 family protein n=1 Tax=Nocardia sp. NBC_01388 TaxID=2903596 RepID=UPI0032437F35